MNLYVVLTGKNETHLTLYSAFASQSTGPSSHTFCYYRTILNHMVHREWLSTSVLQTSQPCLDFYILIYPSKAASMSSGVVRNRLPHDSEVTSYIFTSHLNDMSGSLVYRNDASVYSTFHVALTVLLHDRCEYFPPFRSPERTQNGCTSSLLSYRSM